MNPWTTVILCVVLTIVVMVIDAGLAARSARRALPDKLEKSRAARLAKLESELTDKGQ